MFAHVPLQAPDAIFGINGAFKADPAPDKINLVIGAYRDDEGKPWVLPIVRKIEKEMAENTDLDKEYAPITGLPEFCEETRKLILGKESPSIAEGRVCTIQTLSGTGGLGLGMIFIKRFMTSGKVYISDPSWANHKNIATGNGLEAVPYRYYDKKTGGLDYDGMLEDFEAAPEGSVVLLHVCAHNPTGVDLTKEQWEAVRQVMERKKLIPFFDCAYQGFATGDLDGDAFAVQLFDKAGMNMMITQSYSKNFGLYGERCGALSFVTDSPDTVAKLKSQMSRIVRQNYSNPPRHGAQIVATVLKEPAYFKEWCDQLQVMVDRILAMRKELHAELIALGTPGDWSSILTQIGMFSFTGLSKEQCERMMDKHHVYLLKSGRISMCGLNSAGCKKVAAAMHEVITALPKM